MDERRAAALRYDTSLPAPFLVARGRGAIADRLLTIARSEGIPVQHADDLAERLVALDPGTVIPEELFAPVAEVLAFVLKMDEHVRYSIHNEENRSQ